MTRRGVVRVKISCGGPATARCRGVLRLTVPRRGRPVSIARRRFDLAGGSRATLLVRLSPLGRRLVARRGTLRVRSVVRGSDRRRSASWLRIRG
jgi:hypothetical protein